MIEKRMTYNEICTELNSDWDLLRQKMQYYERKFIQETSKVRRFPTSKVYKPGDQGLSNKYYLSFLRQSQNNTSEIPLSIACKAYDNIGEALLMANPLALSFYQNHFIKRYKERVIKDINASYDDFIESFMKNENSLSGCQITQDLEDVFHCFDGHFTDDKVNLLLTSSYGYSFAEKKGKIVYVKTVITHDMLSERQRQLFVQLKAHGDLLNSMYHTNPRVLPAILDSWVGLKCEKG